MVDLTGKAANGSSLSRNNGGSGNSPIYNLGLEDKFEGLSHHGEEEETLMCERSLMIFLRK
jgi:hypothetical protein